GGRTGQETSDARRHQGRSQVQGVQAGAPVAPLGRAGERRTFQASDEDVRRQVIDSTRGILAMSASVVVFIFNDALIKLASETMPALQAIGLRGIFATAWCVLAIAVKGEGRQVHRIAHPAVALRGLLEAAAAITYLVALAYIPFAIATAVGMSTPL